MLFFRNTSQLHVKHIKHSPGNAWPTSRTSQSPGSPWYHAGPFAAAGCSLSWDQDTWPHLGQQLGVVTRIGVIHLRSCWILKGQFTSKPQTVTCQTCRNVLQDKNISNYLYIYILNMSLNYIWFSGCNQYIVYWIWYIKNNYWTSTARLSMIFLFPTGHVLPCCRRTWRLPLRQPQPPGRGPGTTPCPCVRRLWHPWTYGWFPGAGQMVKICENMWKWKIDHLSAQTIPHHFFWGNDFMGILQPIANITAGSVQLHPGKPGSPILLVICKVLGYTHNALILFEQVALVTNGSALPGCYGYGVVDVLIQYHSWACGMIYSTNQKLETSENLRTSFDSSFDSEWHTKVSN